MLFSKVYKHSMDPFDHEMFLNIPSLFNSWNHSLFNSFSLGDDSNNTILNHGQKSCLNHSCHHDCTIPSNHFL